MGPPSSFDARSQLILRAHQLRAKYLRVVKKHMNWEYPLDTPPGIWSLGYDDGEYDEIVRRMKMKQTKVLSTKMRRGEQTLSNSNVVNPGGNSHTMKNWCLTIVSSMDIQSSTWKEKGKDAYIFSGLRITSKRSKMFYTMRYSVHTFNIWAFTAMIFMEFGILHKLHLKLRNSRYQIEMPIFECRHFWEH